MAYEVLHSFGTEETANMFLRSGEAAVNAEVPMLKIAEDMMLVERAVFSSGGRRGGGSWARLKADTVRKKGSTEILRTLNAKPGYSRVGGDALYKSLSDPGTQYQILRITNDSVTFGTDRPYAGVHQKGSASRNIRARPILRFLPTDVNRWQNWLLRHIIYG